MLTQEDFEAWCKRRQLSDTTRQLIANIRTSDPSRATQGNYGNVCGDYCSEKMTKTIQFESHRGELAHIIDNLEHGKTVLEFYDQPPKIELIYLSKSGKKVRTGHTPDFFVIETDWAGWEEFKPIDELVRKAEEQPNRYVLDAGGNWDCPPGREYAQKYGLDYRVRTSAELHPIRLRNWTWLEPYFQSKPPPFDSPIFQTILTQVQAQPGLTYAQLLLSVENIDLDHLNWLIARELIFINFNIAPLAEPDQVRVFISEELAIVSEKIVLSSPTVPSSDGFHTLNVDIGTTLSWDGECWEITNPGTDRVYLIRQDGKTTSLPNAEFYRLFETGHFTGLNQSAESTVDTTIQDLLHRARPKDIEIANQRYEIIQPYLQENTPPITKVNRSIRRWRDNYLEAEKLYGQGNGYVGLLPRHLDKGHHEKLDPGLVDYMKQYIDDHYFTPTNRRASTIYREFKDACQSLDPPLNPPSDRTFRFYIQGKTNYKLIKARLGSRAAKQSKPFHSTKGFPRNGDLPWECVHIDHTPLDVDLVSSLISLVTCNTSSAITLNNFLLGTCWASFMVDGYSKRILAAYLSFEEPSYRSCMMVMRQCVRRFKRLPQAIITDNGKEFHSIYFKQLLAYYKCNHKYRPPGEPRYGNPVERVFGTTNTLFIHELQGNRQILKHNRQVTKSVNPKTHAVWTLSEFYQALEYWADGIYDTREHFSLGQSPRSSYEIGIALGGKREMRRILYDETFRILTLPSPAQNDSRIVQPGKGIKVNNIYYWCDDFRDPEIEKTAVDVKIDPFNVCLAYAYVRGHWRECTSDHYQFLQGRTEKELKVLSADLRQRKVGHAKRVEISDQELVQHLQSTQAMEGVLLQQRLQALENRTVLDLIEGKPLPQLKISSASDVTATIQKDKSPDSFAQDNNGLGQNLELFGEF